VEDIEIPRFHIGEENYGISILLHHDGRLLGSHRLAERPPYPRDGGIPATGPIGTAARTAGAKLGLRPMAAAVAEPLGEPAQPAFEVIRCGVHRTAYGVTLARRPDQVAGRSGGQFGSEAMIAVVTPDPSEVHMDVTEAIEELGRPVDAPDYMGTGLIGQPDSPPVYPDLHEPILAAYRPHPTGIG